MTEWRPVVGYDGYYEVSSDGDIRSIDKQSGPVYNGKGWCTKRYKGRVLKQHTRDIGHRQVTLHRDGARESRYVHQLVAQAFYGPRPDKHCVRHWNGDPGDNRVENLRYGTASDNRRDVFKDRRLVAKPPNPPRTHCKFGHLIEYPNIRVRTDGSRYPTDRCLVCHRTQNARPGVPLDTLRPELDRRYAELLAEHAYNVLHDPLAIPAEFRRTDRRER